MLFTHEERVERSAGITRCMPAQPRALPDSAGLWCFRPMDALWKGSLLLVPLPSASWVFGSLHGVVLGWPGGGGPVPPFGTRAPPQTRYTNPFPPSPHIFYFIKKVSVSQADLKVLIA